jgi:hypothetical protein
MQTQSLTATSCPTQAANSSSVSNRRIIYLLL